MSPGEGAVTALAFFTPAGGYAPTHLLSGSADGSISVWSVGGGWECMKTMRGHRKEVYGIAVHPSGLLGLSVSRWAQAGAAADACVGRCWAGMFRCGWAVKATLRAAAGPPRAAAARHATPAGAPLAQRRAAAPAPRQTNQPPLLPSYPSRPSGTAS